ncbi:uncharacterized protein CTRU02_211006 [Colletotrichum truncatum]|uniref:Uncharacterized protein n=1 Tax=Colletotrichum truncatum TaxID=5467 RepID=A0ACC3YQU0_COLTU
MASQNDLQELLRLITARKVPMMTAMSQVKALQGVNLRSIQQIADAQPDVIERALGNSKTAKSLQSSCKSYLKLPNSKREGDSTSNNPSAKRLRTAQYADTSTEHKSQSVKEQEGALALPLVTDEDEIARASIYINRAPLMLAFGVELLRFTMPQQPLSSRLSLAQAVVSANSISKAAILGLDSVLRDDISWNEGQPKVTVMGRSIAVLKRGDFDNQPEGCMTAPTTPPQVNENSIVPGRSQWTSSKQITYKSSTFVARVSSLEHPNDAAALIRSLFSCEPHLRTATHNAWGYRVKSEVHSDSIGGGVQEVREDYRDDGERGCGEFILRLMKEANVVGAVVVVTRWFGGEMLGPDRWRLMRGCVMEALAERLRIQHSQAGCHDTALWALDRQHQSETPRGQASSSRDLTHRGRTVSGAVTHRPELARAYLLKSFSVGRSAEEQTSVGENEVACQARRVGSEPGWTLRLDLTSIARRQASFRASKRQSQITQTTRPAKIYHHPASPLRSARLPANTPAPNALETADVIFKARKIPLLASGVVALGLGVYISVLASSFFSSPSCHGLETTPGAVPTGRPNVFTKESARKFDQSLDGSEWLMGITSLRQKLAAEASGHVLEVAIGTGRNMSFYDWSFVLQPNFSPKTVETAQKTNRKSASASVLSFTGVDISGEMLEVAIEKLSAAVPQLKGVEPTVKMQIPTTSGLTVVSYLSDRLRFIRTDIHNSIPPPAQQTSTPARYDTVVQTFGLCSVQDPERVVQNLASLVKPDTGRIILVEHGRGWWGIVNGLLDKSAASHFQKYGCWWNRDIAEIVENTAKSTPGLEIVKIERPYLTQLGTTLWIELRVRKSGEF